MRIARKAVETCFILLLLVSSSTYATSSIRCARVLDFQFQNWRMSWNSISNENPKNHTPYFAIGIFDYLQGGFRYFEDGFVDKMTYQTNHYVFSIVTNGSGFLKYLEAGVPISPQTLHFTVKIFLNYMLLIPAILNERSPTTKNVLVNLDGVDLKHPESKTTTELIHLLKNPELLAHSRWFLNGREMSFDEIYSVFEKFRAAFPEEFKLRLLL